MPRLLKTFIYFSFLTLALASVEANADPRIAPLTIGPTCAKVTLEEASINEETMGELARLTPEDFVQLNLKRQEVIDRIYDLVQPHLRKIGYFTGPIACLKPNGERARSVGLRKLAKALVGLDKEMIENSTVVGECSRWGICSAIDIQVGLGFLKYFALAGGTVAWDLTTKFGDNDWQVDKYVDVVRGKYAYTPVLVGSAGMSFIVNFYSPIEGPVRKFESTYAPLVPGVKVVGDETLGYGVYLAASLPPALATLYAYKNKTRRYSIGHARAYCDRLLVSTNERWKNRSKKVESP